jgi:hypothetical protein
MNDSGVVALQRDSGNVLIAAVAIRTAGSENLYNVNFIDCATVDLDSDVPAAYMSSESA